MPTYRGKKLKNKTAVSNEKLFPSFKQVKSYLRTTRDERLSDLKVINIEKKKSKLV